MFPPARNDRRGLEGRHSQTAMSASNPPPAHDSSVILDAFVFRNQSWTIAIYLLSPSPAFGSAPFPDSDTALPKSSKHGTEMWPGPPQPNNLTPGIAPARQGRKESRHHKVVLERGYLVVPAPYARLRSGCQQPTASQGAE